MYAIPSNAIEPHTIFLSSKIKENEWWPEPAGDRGYEAYSDFPVAVRFLFACAHCVSNACCFFLSTQAPSSGPKEAAFYTRKRDKESLRSQRRGKQKPTSRRRLC